MHIVIRGQTNLVLERTQHRDRRQWKSTVTETVDLFMVRRHDPVSCILVPSFLETLARSASSVKATRG